VRVVAASDLPLRRRATLFDFILFDGAVSYESMLAARIDTDTRPTIVSTRLNVQPQVVEDRRARFNDLWDIAAPYETRLDQSH
jgi:hypothetical protein